MTNMGQVCAVSKYMYAIAYKVKWISFLSYKCCLQNITTEIPVSQNIIDKTILTSLKVAINLKGIQ